MVVKSYHSWVRLLRRTLWRKKNQIALFEPQLFLVANIRYREAKKNLQKRRCWMRCRKHGNMFGCTRRTHMCGWGARRQLHGDQTVGFCSGRAPLEGCTRNVHITQKFREWLHLKIGNNIFTRDDLGLKDGVLNYAFLPKKKFEKSEPKSQKVKSPRSESKIWSSFVCRLPSPRPTSQEGKKKTIVSINRLKKRKRCVPLKGQRSLGEEEHSDWLHGWLTKISNPCYSTSNKNSFLASWSCFALS